MNKEAQAITDPIAQKENFAEIEEVDERLDGMYEATRAAKKELMDFRPIFRILMSRSNNWIQL
jgi:hypothetical protein